MSDGLDPLAAGSGLTYFDRSRRQFIKITGLSLAGLMLPASFQPDARASGLSTAVDRAIAWALHDVGAKAVTHVPASGASSIFEAYHAETGKPPRYAFNEELAYTIAHGAALAGCRAAAVLKAHGLAKAANSVIDTLTLGTTAGFVIIVPDDRRGSHSDSIFDLESFLRGTGIPFKRSGAATVYADVQECFLWSEELETPVALFIDAEELDRQTALTRRPLAPPTGRYSRNPWTHVLCPPLAGFQRAVFEARLARKNWRQMAPPALPLIPAGLPPAWRSQAERFVPVFEVFQDLRPKIPVACGDTGLSSLFAFPPFACVDTCSYYGGSLPMAIGFHLAGFGGAWAVTGDYAFIAAGHMGLIEAKALGIPLKVLILDNGGAMATGGQPVPAGVFDQVLAGWKAHVRRLDNPDDKAAVRAALNRAIESDRLEIVHARLR